MNRAFADTVYWIARITPETSGIPLIFCKQ